MIFVKMGLGLKTKGVLAHFITGIIGFISNHLTSNVQLKKKTIIIYFFNFYSFFISNRNVPIEKREPMVSTAEKIIQKSGFKVGIAHCALECKPAVSWDKGRASIQILKTIFGENWSENVGTIFAGDDVTDEDAMMALKGKAYSFRISDNQQIKTSADKILPSTDSVLLMLKWVEKHMIQ